MEPLIAPRIAPNETFPVSSQFISVPSARTIPFSMCNSKSTDRISIFPPSPVLNETLSRCATMSTRPHSLQSYLMLPVASEQGRKLNPLKAKLESGLSFSGFKSLNTVSALPVTLISSKSRVYLFTQGSRPGRTVGESVGGIFETGSSDWSSGIRYHIFDLRPDIDFNRFITSILV